MTCCPQTHLLYVKVSMQLIRRVVGPAVCCYSVPALQCTVFSHALSTVDHWLLSEAAIHGHLYVQSLPVLTPSDTDGPVLVLSTVEYGNKNAEVYASSWKDVPLWAAGLMGGPAGAGAAGAAVSGDGQLAGRGTHAPLRSTAQGQQNPQGSRGRQQQQPGRADQ